MTLMVILLLGQAICKIPPLKPNLPAIQLAAGDVYTCDAELHFDFTQVKGRIFSKSNMGKALSMDDYNSKRTIKGNSQGVLDQVKKIYYNLVVLTQRETHVTFQWTNANQTMLDHDQQFDFGTLNSLKRCTGFAYNPERNLIYVGCFNSNTFYVYTYDPSKKSVIATTPLPQQAQHGIKTRLVLDYIYLGGKKYLFAYQQGYKGSIFGNFPQVIVYTGTESKLVYAKTLIIKPASGAKFGLSTFFNIYNQNDRLIVTGAASTSASSMFAAVVTPQQFNIASGILPIGPFARTYNFKNGMVVVRGNRYLVLNKDTRTFKHFALDPRDTFEQSKWGTKLLKELDHIKLDIVPDGQAREMVANKYGMVINWDTYSYDGDVGDTFASYNTTAVDFLPLTDTTHFDKSYLFCLGQRFVGYMIGINLGDEGTLFVTHDDLLKSGPTTVQFGMKDNSPTEFVNIPAQALTTLLAPVQFTKKTSPTLTLKSGASGVVQFDKSFVLVGNALDKVTFSLSPSNANVSFKFVKNYNLKIDYNQTPATITQQWFSGKYHVTASTSGLTFWTCSPGSSVSIARCLLTKIVPYVNGLKYFSNRIVSSENGVFAFQASSSSSGKMTTILLFDITQTKFTQYPLNSLSNGIEIYSSSNSIQILASTSSSVIVLSYKSGKLTLSRTYQASDFFVPSISIIGIGHQARSSSRFDVLTVSNGFPNVYRLDLNDPTFQEISRIPVDVAPKGICSIGREIVVYSKDRIFSLDSFNPFRYSSVNYKDFGISKGISLGCVTDAHKFTFQGISSTKSLVSVISEGESYSQQGTRFPSKFTYGSGSVLAGTYEFFGNVINVVLSNGKLVAQGAYDYPLITATAGNVSGSQTVNVSVTVSNGKGSGTFKRTINLRN